MASDMKSWVITWGNRTWTDADLTAGDAAIVETLVDGGWETCDPWRGPMELMSMIATLEARASDRDVRDVLAEVRQILVSELRAAITVP